MVLLDNLNLTQSRPSYIVPAASRQIEHDDQLDVMAAMTAAHNFISRQDWQNAPNNTNNVGNGLRVLSWNNVDAHHIDVHLHISTAGCFLGRVISSSINGPTVSINAETPEVREEYRDTLAEMRNSSFAVHF